MGKREKRIMLSGKFEFRLCDEDIRKIENDTDHTIEDYEKNAENMLKFLADKLFMSEGVELLSEEVRGRYVNFRQRKKKAEVAANEE